jgi:hypothetical protein
MQPTADDALWLVVYVSAATREFSNEELDGLLRAARENNAAVGITGMLAYHDGSFMQAIEGPRSAVEALYRRIESDPRHKGPLVLLRHELTARHFGDWSMAFRRYSDADVPEGFSRLMQAGLHTARSSEGHGDRVHQLLQTFADTQLRRRG